MTTIHFHSHSDQPVRIAEVDTRHELSEAIVDNGPADQQRVAISEDAARCQTCPSTECEHVERVEKLLADHDLPRPGAPSG